MKISEFKNVLYGCKSFQCHQSMCEIRHLAGLSNGATKIQSLEAQKLNSRLHIHQKDATGPHQINYTVINKSWVVQWVLSF